MNTKRWELVAAYYRAHPGSSRQGCCEAIYGKVNYFLLNNLSQLERRMRKGGNLFYSCGEDGMVDMADKDVAVSKKMKIQKRMLGGMLGSVKANVRIVEAATDALQIQAAEDKLHEVDTLLAEARNYFYEYSRNTRKQIDSRQEATKKVLESK